VLRSVAEFFREPDAHVGFELLGWVTRGQLLSLPMILLGLWLWLRANRQSTER
jgi:phosphatidylglycerol:prolipoprotein diacylglycerol transferase